MRILPMLLLVPAPALAQSPEAEVADVRNRYNFYIGERIDRCGVDSFLQVADTQRREGCAPFDEEP